MHFPANKWLSAIVCSFVIAACMLTIATLIAMRDAPVAFKIIDSDIKKARILDRHGQPLTITYQNQWNTHDVVALHQIPDFLQQAIVIAEDKRFYRHHGIDWWARLHAVWQNLKAFSAVRGASTISEQVVRMLHPRPRTAWSKWLEGFEARQLEQRLSKADILEFYLNQVPYASQRRGVAQAARYYFNRDLDTLNQKEMLALAVLIRAPGRLDLYGANKKQINRPINRLANIVLKHNLINAGELQQIQNEILQLEKPALPVKAKHFVNYIDQSSIDSSANRIQTTLDSELQNFTQSVLDRQVSHLHKQRVNNGAALVVDHQSNEILAWVVTGTDIDTVQALRQPGSTLKPFVYAAALEKGWTASTMIEDEPLSKSVGYGLHPYHNYSRTFYGSVSLREALGNSLNIPAIKAAQYVGINEFLHKLHQLGIKSLRQHPDYYGDGLALGNGEISLFELVNAYAVLARGGSYQPLTGILNQLNISHRHSVFSPEITSLIGYILSDPDSRQLEFGATGILQLPLQTAVKTGTSSDYRDAWIVGYNHRYTVGVWMGNVDNTPMREVTGSKGPAVVLRAVFSELNKVTEPQALFFSRKLTSHDVCIATGLLANRHCTTRSEWFLAENTPKKQVEVFQNQSIQIRQPSSGLLLAMDPRIPDEKEAFRLALNDDEGVKKVKWHMNGQLLATTRSPGYTWNLKRGQHNLYAEIWLDNQQGAIRTKDVTFLIK